MESDSQTLIQALLELSPPPSSVATLVYGSLASSHTFRYVDFSHVGRRGNRPADLLARHALGIANFQFGWKRFLVS